MSERRSPSVSLIVVNYRAAALCARIVTALLDAVEEIIVVDNTVPCSPDLDELERLERVEVVRVGTNVGFGSAANLGARLATGEVLVISNPDVLITPDGLARLVDRAYGLGLTGPRFHFPDGSLQRSAHRRDPLLLATVFELCPPLGGIVHRFAPDWHPTLFSSADHQRELSAAHVLGALFAIDKRAFVDVGGFDEEFFLYREETDLCRRLLSRGWKVTYTPLVEAEHVSGASSENDWPLTAMPVWLESHYNFIRKHRSVLLASVARSLGLLASCAALLDQRRRHSAWRTLRWHLGLPVRGRS